MEWAVLRDLDEASRRLVLQQAVRRKYRRGEALFFEGDAGDTLHLLAKGRVAVRVSSPLGETVTLDLLGPGASFGELALLSEPGTRTATVVALEAVETLTVRRSVFNELRAQHPEVERFLVELLAAQVQRLSTHLLEGLVLAADARVLRRLVDAARVYDGGQRDRYDRGDGGCDAGDGNDHGGWRRLRATHRTAQCLQHL